VCIGDRHKPLGVEELPDLNLVSQGLPNCLAPGAGKHFLFDLIQSQDVSLFEVLIWDFF
jgi:hypothetical protein